MEGLADRHILILEDEYFIASDLKLALDKAGAKPIGPVGDVQAAFELVVAERIDAAILDINLEGKESYPLVDALTERLVPFLFLTGYDDWAIPERYRACPRVAKPAPVETVLDAISKLIRR